MNLDAFLWCSDAEVSSLPTAPGVYMVEKDGQALYAGTTHKLKERLAAHPVVLKYRPVRIRWHIIRDKAKRHKAEMELIAKYGPKLNQRKGNRNYAKGNFRTQNVRLTLEDDPMIAKAIKIVEKRGLIRPTAADAFRIALAEFVRGGK